mmetsp:Transcript_24095/g.75512  ORF Transcript_24095/g.75512 Transcript_24095/m.75512 type:complete len:373 (-) Transcript_24095:1175-2293(-)
MVHHELVRLAALLLAHNLELAARHKVREAGDGERVAGADLVVVGLVSEGEGEHALLLQVGFVDARERLDDHRAAAEVARLERGVLAGRALAVVLIADHHPRDARGLVRARGGGHGVEVPGHLVEDLVGLAVLVVDGADEHVVGDIVQVAAVLEPRARHGDVVGGALAPGLDEDLGVRHILAVKLLEAREELEALRGGVHDHGNVGAVGGGGLEGVHAGVEALLRELIAKGGVEHNLLAVGAHEGVLLGVEGEVARDGEGGHDLGGGDEAVRGRVAVVARGEVAVERGDDGVGGALGHVVAAPLADAGAARVGHHGAAGLLEDRELAVAGDGGADLLGAGGDGEGHLGLDPGGERLLSDRGGAGHVLVGGVGA